jgi:hypothetical protein
MPDRDVIRVERVPPLRHALVTGFPYREGCPGCRHVQEVYIPLVRRMERREMRAGRDA